VANRARLRTFIESQADRPEQPLGALVIDLDGFKKINDHAGHDVGDEVLRVVAGRMRGLVRPGDMLARTGGDEFVVVLTGTDSTATLAGLADRMGEVIGEPIDTARGPQRVGASIGRAAGRGDVDALLTAADADMYRIKQQRHRMERQRHRAHQSTPFHGEQLTIG
jgi:diguanylate cyclase (GGDEF)-like protein